MNLDTATELELSEHLAQLKAAAADRRNLPSRIQAIVALVFDQDEVQAAFDYWPSGDAAIGGDLL